MKTQQGDESTNRNANDDRATPGLNRSPGAGRDDPINPTATPPPFSPAGSIPSRIGNFKILKVIAGGAMGTVYEAVQENPPRRVALKVIKRGITSWEALRRFQFETTTLGRLCHPGIARIYEAGTHRDGVDGVPYFALEYVENARILTQFAAERKLALRPRLELFLQVCDAVHYGHQKGVIHRDLKPGNILVNAGGRVKVIDFGVARSTDADMAVTTTQTSPGALIGTPRYMSPEQCAADPRDLDIRSDVYSLGVLLFELLSGKMPYDMDTPPFEYSRVIRESEPIRLGKLGREFRGDLERIVGKALEKERDRRYPSADALSEDIQRFLRCEPIQARPKGRLYQLTRFVQRERRLVALAAALVIVAGAALYFLLAAHRTQAEIMRRDVRARDANAFLARQADRDLNDRIAIMADCTATIEQNPDLSVAYALRGKMWAVAGQKEDARRDCARALELDPSSSLALRTMAYLYLEDGEFDNAKDAFERGMQTIWIGEARAEDFHNRARLWRMIGRFDRALEEHKRAAALAPNKGLVYLSRGITRYFNGDTDGALEDWATAGRIDPKDHAPRAAFFAWEARMLRAAPGDPEAAANLLREVEEAAKAYPDTAAIRNLYLGLGSEREVQATAAIPADRCAAYYALGIHALVQHRSSDAESWLAQCLQTGAHNMAEYDMATWRLARLRGE